VLIALLDNPVSALWVLAFIVAYQQFENMILSPRITAYLHRYEVIASPLTSTPYPTRRAQ
jgi:hypothetical protein